MIERKNIFYSVCCIILSSFLFLSCATDEAEKDVTEISSSDSPVSSPGAGSSNVSSNDESTYDTQASFSPIYFNFDSSAVSKKDYDKINKISQHLKNKPYSKVTIEGHCDDRGTTQYNLALGKRRASSVKDILLKAGANKSQISTVSYGEESPSVEGQGEAAWSKNRRAVFAF